MLDFAETAVIFSGQDVTIHCPVLQRNPGNYTLTLKFGDSSTILNYSQASQLPTNAEWGGKRLHVALDGTVTIHNLGNSRDTGTYSCIRFTAQSREEVLTQVQIKSGQVICGGIFRSFIFIIIEFMTLKWIISHR